jgi:predicted nuclease with TOPRIM domain
MEEEMNYLSEKIDKYESSITELERLAAQQSDYNYSLQKLRKEKKLLENILNKLTEIELT